MLEGLHVRLNLSLDGTQAPDRRPSHLCPEQAHSEGRGRVLDGHTCEQLAPWALPTSQQVSELSVFPWDWGYGSQIWLHNKIT